LPSTNENISNLPLVLLVDDSIENRKLLKILLSKQPIVLHEAGNGREALEMFEKHGYSILLMDIQMPIMDGYTATRQIRRIEEGTGRARTPIIALTAYASENDFQTSMEAGCDDHIAKPFKKKTLIDCLARYLHWEQQG
jgi:CheY-like chemotaxis protein